MLLAALVATGALRLAAGETGWYAQAARDHAKIVIEIDRVAAGALSGAELLEKYILADVPVVIEGAVTSPEVLARLRAVGSWEVGAARAPEWFSVGSWEVGGAPEWFLELLASLDGASDGGLDYAHEAQIDVKEFGCRGNSKQCRIAWWYSGSPPAAPGVPKQGGGGAYVHTDAICMPAWSLQVSGRKEWTFAKRGDAEIEVPLGDEFFGEAVYSTFLEPGDLMLFFNGWHPHSTNPAKGAAFTASIHGIVTFPDAAQLLWGAEGVDRKRGSVPSQRLLEFCRDVRSYGGFENFKGGEIQAVQGGEEACASPNEAWRPRLPASMGLVADIDVGYLASPALGDLDHDGDFDLVVGDSQGNVAVFENVGDSQRAKFVLRPDRALKVDRLASPALGDLDGDGVLDAVVGAHDHLVFFQGPDFTLQHKVKVSLHDKVRRRLSPLLFDVDGDGELDVILGHEGGDLLVSRNAGGFSFENPETAFHTFQSLHLGLQGRERCRLANVASAVINEARCLVIGDGGTGSLRFYQVLDDAKTGFALQAFKDTSGLASVSLDAIADSFPLDIGAYSSPALADLDGDGKDDLILGGLYGTLLFFDAATRPPRGFTEDDDD
ncbi:hypothetical protein M885DRAFT_612671 [Pelagophyceae sp. CCMP2097]|nr:hypothetical protein M885DRAFT_612671 [Pelagophyceae sp. CCMP2097]|mmetsp:Transcript_5377/g.19052  ORF Transcript_5377/g.19052 Transcript_5377/m.19052 type:complete len:608 (+) Transcript_5377:27-1850(+)